MFPAVGCSNPANMFSRLATTAVAYDRTKLLVSDVYADIVEGQYRRVFRTMPWIDLGYVPNIDFAHF